jgi:two-component system response regulator YesN
MNLEQITQNLFTLTRTPIVLISKFDTEKKFLNYNIPYQMKGIIKGNRKFVKDNSIDYLVYRFKDYTELCYCSFKILESTVIVGPFLERDASSKVIHNLSIRLNLIQSEHSQLEQFYHNLSILNDDELDFIYNIFSNIMHMKFRPPEFTEIYFDHDSVNANYIHKELLAQSDSTLRNFNVEEQFTSIIEKGDVYRAEDFNASYILSHTTQGEEDSLQDEKTRLRIFEAICNRAAIRGGIDIQFANQISKNFELSINSLNSIKESESLSQDIILDYTWAVNNYSLQGHSNLIRQAVLFIRRNLALPYGLNRLASDLQVSKEHLSREFKKETGKTVSLYIQHSKVLEAIEMLKHSKYSVADISIRLGFSSSSYFTTVFKRHMGLSPKQYVVRNLK